MEKREEVWKPLAPHLETMKNDRESLSRANKVNINSSSIDTIAPTKKNQRHSAISIRHSSTEEHDDQSLLRAKLQNIRLYLEYI